MLSLGAMATLLRSLKHPAASLASIASAILLITQLLYTPDANHFGVHIPLQDHSDEKSPLVRECLPDG
jgi:hypothetical protein